MCKNRKHTVILLILLTEFSFRRIENSGQLFRLRTIIRRTYQHCRRPVLRDIHVPQLFSNSLSLKTWNLLSVLPVTIRTRGSLSADLKCKQRNLNFQPPRCSKHSTLCSTVPTAHFARCSYFSDYLTMLCHKKLIFSISCAQSSLSASRDREKHGTIWRVQTIVPQTLLISAYERYWDFRCIITRVTLRL